MKRTFYILCCALLLAGCTSPSLVYPPEKTQIPTSAPMMTDSPGQSARMAASTVFRIICPQRKRGGSAFLHKSGKVITAAHIVDGAEPNEVLFITAAGKKIKVRQIIRDRNLDLALLTPESKLTGNCLPISCDSQFTIGSQVAIWGYPTGYNSATPLLSVGYLSGQDHVASPGGKLMNRWVVNAAINLGNSGGPLVHVESGKVIGVVSSKLAPMPEYIEQALAALKRQKAIIVFKKTKPDGSEERMSTAQVVEEVLQYLRSQTQLVIGHTVPIGDLRGFLKGHAVDP